MKIVLAVPTISERGSAWREVSERFRASTRRPLLVVPSWAPGSWSAGLNEVWRAHRDADVLVCGSDDMVPRDEGWLEPLLAYARRGFLPAPTVVDPRWTNYGGHLEPVRDGTPSVFSPFPLLRGDWLHAVFPLPDDLHYYADNLIADRLRAIGVECVAVPAAVVVHLWDDRGRGAGAGSEEARIARDVERYMELRRIAGTVA